MIKILMNTLLFISTNIILCSCYDAVLDNTELVMALMIHRHGDRTPIKETLPFCTEREQVKKLIDMYGFGQLTNLGKQRSYELGKFIRRRYDCFLSPNFNGSEIHIRSTDSTRTKMTVLTAMAAVYPPPKDNWSQDIVWTPVPFTTVPMMLDYNLATMNCPVVVEALHKAMKTPDQAMVDKYKVLLEKISDIHGINVTERPVLAYVVYDAYISQIHLGIPLGNNYEEMLPELHEAASEALDKLLKENISLQAGVLLKEFFDAVDRVLTGDETKRIQIYSAHDLNVYAFEVITKIRKKQGTPKYCALYSLELRKVLKSDKEEPKYIVVPVYIPEPGQREIYLPVEGCKGFCDLASFRRIVEANAIDLMQYRSQCGYGEKSTDTSAIE